MSHKEILDTATAEPSNVVMHSTSVPNASRHSSPPKIRELREQRQMPELVRLGIQRGWIRLRPPLLKPEISEEERKARMRLQMARLRAERRGKDTSKFPPRIRRRRKQR